MRRLVLIRHAESEANVIGSLHCAVPGPPLTELGHQQADALARRFAGDDAPWKIGAVWSSEMTRARQTAAALAAKLDLPARAHSSLHEGFVGDLHDRNDEEAHQLFDELSVRWYLDDDLDARRPGGESGAEIVARVTTGLREIAAEIPLDGTAAVVSHGAALRLTIPRVASGVSYDHALRHHLPNTSYVEIEIHSDTDWRCVQWDGVVPA